MSPDIKKKMVKLLSVHGVTALLLVYFTHADWAKSDMCNPGFNVLSILVAFILTLVLFGKSVIDTIKDRQNKYLLFISLSVILAWVALIAWSSNQ